MFPDLPFPAFIIFYDSHLIKLVQAVLDVLLEQGLVVLVPATQSGTAFGDVTSTPHDPELVDLLACLVIRADDVEQALADLVELWQGQFAMRERQWVDRRI